MNFCSYFAFYVYGPTIRNCVVGHCLVNMTAVVKVVIHCVLILHYYKRNTLAIIIYTIIILIDSVPHLCLWRLLSLWSTDRVLGRSLCEMFHLTCTSFTIRFWHFSSAAFIEKNAVFAFSPLGVATALRQCLIVNKLPNCE